MSDFAESYFPSFYWSKIQCMQTFWPNLFWWKCHFLCNCKWLQPYIIYMFSIFSYIQTFTWINARQPNRSFITFYCLFSFCSLLISYEVQYCLYSEIGSDLTRTQMWSLFAFLLSMIRPFLLRWSEDSSYKLVYILVSNVHQ
jgi:hypothetical protein